MTLTFGIAMRGKRAGARPRPMAAMRGTRVDYDLGYDATGWDTNGFRRPEAGYADSHAGAHSARAAGPWETAHRRVTTPGRPRTQEITPLKWEPDAPQG